LILSIEGGKVVAADPAPGIEPGPLGTFLTTGSKNDTTGSLSFPTNGKMAELFLASKTDRSFSERVMLCSLVQ
jgi:hypothetical protein